MERLKREHAIETGIIERIYDLKKGVTETLIKEGFVKSYLSYGDTNVSKDELMNHLGDHLDAVDFVFDIVKQNRRLSVSFIKELHQLTTRHQQSAEGRDQFGNRLKILLLKGVFKERENNPTTLDGTKILYCPPVHVDAEMYRLVSIYEELTEEEVNPLTIATWFHHAFVSIHPFQDGNGRVARLLTSLIFIKYGFFPFTVLREDAKVKYINALEKADSGELQPLIT
ncbi:MAG: Fic family protein [Bacteroidota bacterium]